MAVKSRAEFKPTKLEKRAFQVFRRLREVPEIRGARILVAVSGGVDSVALLDLMSQFATRLDVELCCSYVHHGPTGDRRLRSARDRAEKLVRKICRRHSIAFMIGRAPNGTGALRSEEELREFRYSVLRAMARRKACRWIALAHHADDLLETRMIRLIRGTGPYGLEAMSEWKEDLLRPLLRFSRDEIEAYARSRGLDWLEDPSNQSSEPLRNWLRRDWLPALESKRPGSCASLARSLELIAQAPPLVPPKSRGLARIDLSRLGLSERRARIARLFLENGARNFTQAHVEEVLKRLESRRNQGRQRLRMLQLDLEINAGHVLVNLVSKEKRRNHAPTKSSAKMTKKTSAD